MKRGIVIVGVLCLCLFGIASWFVPATANSTAIENGPGHPASATAEPAQNAQSSASLAPDSGPGDISAAPKSSHDPANFNRLAVSPKPDSGGLAPTNHDVTCPGTNPCGP